MSEKRDQRKEKLTEDESLFDMHEDMQTVDEIPNEELNQQVKDEKNKEHTKDTSSSEQD